MHMKDFGRGQVALETIIVIGFVLALMAPFLYMLFMRIGEVQQELTLLEATRAADTIATSVATVGVIGPNGSATIEVYFPQNIQNLVIGNATGGPGKEITITVSTYLGDIDIPRISSYDMTEDPGAKIPVKQGKQKIKIVNPETGAIVLSGVR